MLQTTELRCEAIIINLTIFMPLKKGTRHNSQRLDHSWCLNYSLCWKYVGTLYWSGDDIQQQGGWILILSGPTGLRMNKTECVNDNDEHLIHQTAHVNVQFLLLYSKS